MYPRRQIVRKTAKMNNELFLGIDTSNYTTSVALADGSGEVIANLKRPLPVKAGERGLRQSDAVFEHVRGIPELMGELRGVLAEKYPDGYRIAAVGVSAFPRDAVGSYMPCFLSGISAAESIGAAVGCPVYRFSHQRGHIAAALYSAGATELAGRRFGAFHVSGGTTEVLTVEPDDELIIGITNVGGTVDINAGQAIDRVGVAMGLPFPAGAELERLAKGYTGKIMRPRLSVNGLNCNLSGVENIALKMYADTGDTDAVAAFVIDFVVRTLEALTANLTAEYGDIPVVYSGGVMSCSILKERLAGADTYFAEPKYSADNAAGIAWLTRETHIRKTR